MMVADGIVFQSFLIIYKYLKFDENQLSVSKAQQEIYST